MLPIKQEMLTNKTNRPFLRDQTKYAIRQLKGIVAHWTANTKKGADARANRNYFNGSAMYASAHYIVDDGEIIQCIPDNEVGYHVGANSYKPDGERIMAKTNLSPNYFLIGFEMCVNEDGDWNKTYKNSVELAAYLLRKYRFTTADLYRHFDITGKDCPKMMLTPTSWGKFRADVAKAMADDPRPPIRTGRVTTDGLNVRNGAGASFTAVGKLDKGDAVQIFEEKTGWLRIGTGRWVSGKYIETTFTTRNGIIADPTGANVRAGAGSTFKIVDALPNGTLVDIIGQNDRWLQIGPDRWVAASLVQNIEIRRGTVVGTDSLNVRSGPATTFPIVKKLSKGDEVQVFEAKDKWLRIGTGEWVFQDFVQL